MIRGALSLFLPRYPAVLIYMLQSTEYQVKPYLAWYWRTNNFAKVAHRRDLDRTRRAGLLLRALQLGILLQASLGLAFIWQAFSDSSWRMGGLGLVIILSYPLVWAHIIMLPLIVARMLVVKPKEKRRFSAAKHTFANSKAVKIAVAGSYGKTTMKELLNTILSEGKQVAASPANKNVAVSHAQFARKLTGKEEVIIVEYGEGQPGDVPMFNQLFQPTIGVITGLAPAHLDKYKTVQAAGRDIFSLASYVGDKNVFVNEESGAMMTFITQGMHQYSRNGVIGWKVSNVKIDIRGMQFTMTHGKDRLRLQTQLIGRHLLGPLSACVALAWELGLSDAQIKAGVAKTKPFEHRMEPRPLAGGWIIDDTYNGNLEGVRAGVELLKELSAKRKTYVTPGLVEQGDAAESVHREMGRLIGDAEPDRVVLMKNSVTSWIEAGLQTTDFSGELRIEEDPLDFYTKIEHLMAVGDVVMMQNDWPDNYK